MDFENYEELLEYVAKIEKALKKQNLSELAFLLGKKFNSVSEANDYFNNVWKREARIKTRFKNKTGFK